MLSFKILCVIISDGPAALVSGGNIAYNTLVQDTCCCVADIMLDVPITCRNIPRYGLYRYYNKIEYNILNDDTLYQI